MADVGAIARGLAFTSVVKLAGNYSGQLKARANGFNKYAVPTKFYSAPVSIGGNNNGVISGVINESGVGPMSGALVRLYYRPTGGMIGQTFTDASGFYQFKYLDSTDANAYTVLAMSRYGTSLSGGDANYNNVSLLLHFDGANGSTTFTDSGAGSRVVTANGNAQISTTTPKFGTGCGTFDGSGDYLTVPHSTDFDFGTDSFTIECFVRLASLGSNAIILQKASGTSFFPWQLWYNASTQKLGARGFDTGTSLFYDLAQINTAALNTWYHLALVRNGSTFTFYLDGVSQQTATSSNTVYSASSNVAIGAADNGAACLNGQLDALRITKGVARYAGNFTPPTTPFPTAVAGIVNAGVLDLMTPS